MITIEKTVAWKNELFMQDSDTREAIFLQPEHLAEIRRTTFADAVPVRLTDHGNEGPVTILWDKGPCRWFLGQGRNNLILADEDWQRLLAWGSNE